MGFSHPFPFQQSRMVPWADKNLRGQLEGRDGGLEETF